MVGYPITYGDDLTQEQVNKRLKEVLMGAVVVLGLYLLLTQAANAVDDKTPLPGLTGGPPVPPVPPVPPGPPGPPGGPPGPPGTSLAPAGPVPAPPTTSVQNITGLEAAFYGTAINTSGFWIGVLCGLVVIALIRTVQTSNNVS